MYMYVYVYNYYHITIADASLTGRRVPRVLFLPSKPFFTIHDPFVLWRTCKADDRARRGMGQAWYHTPRGCEHGLGGHRRRAHTRPVSKDMQASAREMLRDLILSHRTNSHDIHQAQAAFCIACHCTSNPVPRLHNRTEKIK